MSFATMFVDESHHTNGRYRSVAAVTVLGTNLHIRETFRNAIELSKHEEIKFSNLNNADGRISALAMFDAIIPELLAGSMRIDVLVWDTYDKRNTVPGRKDNLT